MVPVAIVKPPSHTMQAAAVVVDTAEAAEMVETASQDITTMAAVVVAVATVGTAGMVETVHVLLPAGKAAAEAAEAVTAQTAGTAVFHTIPHWMHTAAAVAAADTARSEKVGTAVATKEQEKKAGLPLAVVVAHVIIILNTLPEVAGTESALSNITYRRYAT